jgi:hypothetical protein
LLSVERIKQLAVFPVNLGMPWLIATASGWFPLLAKLEVVIMVSPYFRPH